MSPLHDDGHGSTATAVAVAVVALAVLIPVVTVAATAPSSGPQSAQKTAPAGADHSAAPCEQRSGSTATGSVARGPEEATANGSRTSEGAETVPLGGIASLRLSVADGLENTVVIGDGTPYEVRTTVTDDGDGQVTLRINTFAAANRTAVGPRAYRALGEDRLTVETNETNETMTEGTYFVAVYRDGAPVDERRLNVTAPDFGTVTALAGPPQLFDAGTLDALRTAEELGTLSWDRTGDNASHVDFGETLVFRIESPTLLGAVAAQHGDSPVERFQRVYGHDPVGFEIRGPCVYFAFAENVERGAVRAVADYPNGTAYLLVDQDRAETKVDYGEFQIKVDEPNPLGMDFDYIDFDRAQYHDHDQRPTVDRLGPTSYTQRVDGIVSWPSGDFVEISGERDGYPGPIPVTVLSLTDPTDVVRTSTDPAGDSFRALVDLPDDSNPGLFEVTVGNTSYTARVGDPPNATWELSSPSERERVDRVPIEQLTLEDGGFLVAYRPTDSGTDNATKFERVGTAGTRDISMPVAPLSTPTHLVVVAHRDGNDNGRFDGAEMDPPYRVGGDVVREWATIEVSGDTPSGEPPRGSFALSKVGEPAEGAPVGTTVEPTPTATPTPTQSRTSTALTPEQTPTTTPTSDSMPTTADRADGEAADDSAARTTVSTTGGQPNAATPGADRTGGTSADGEGVGAAGVLVALVSVAAVLVRWRS